RPVRKANRSERTKGAKQRLDHGRSRGRDKTPCDEVSPVISWRQPTRDRPGEQYRSVAQSHLRIRDRRRREAINEARRRVLWEGMRRRLDQVGGEPVLQMS